MQVVNGYVCRTGCDADLARRNINPADPQDDVHNPKSANYGKPEDPRHPGKPAPTWESPSVSFGGALAKANLGTAGAGAGGRPTLSNQAYSPGSTVDISA